MTAVLVVRVAVGEPAQAVEQVGVDEDRRARGASYVDIYATVVASRQPVAPSAGHDPAVTRSSPVDRFEPNLRIPGPTALPPSVRVAGGRQMINHRGPEFAAMLERILTGMQPFFGTTSDIAMISTAGLGRAGGRGRQRPVARRRGPRREHRLVRRPVRQDRRHLRRRRDQARRRVGLRRRRRRGPRATARACPTSGPCCSPTTRPRPG